MLYLPRGSFEVLLLPIPLLRETGSNASILTARGGHESFMSWMMMMYPIMIKVLRPKSQPDQPPRPPTFPSNRRHASPYVYYNHLLQ